MVASLQDCRRYTGIMFEVGNTLEKPAIPIVYGPASRNQSTRHACHRAERLIQIRAASRRMA